jgi:two-component system chemotaxis response regulator CheY
MKNCTVLIIDDDRFGQMLLQQILEKNGFITLLADDGQKAITQLMRHTDIEVCLLDLNMPVMDGYGFLEALSELTRTFKVYITSCNTIEDFLKIARTKNINMSLVRGYFEKPFQFNKIIEKLVADLKPQ